MILRGSKNAFAIIPVDFTKKNTLCKLACHEIISNYVINFQSI